MTKTELLDFIKEAKELGLKSIEIDGVKIEFIENPQKVIKQDNIDPNIELKPEDIVVPMSKYDQLTDEEILFWSTGYGVELQEEKEREQQRRKDIIDGNIFK